MTISCWPLRAVAGAAARGGLTGRIRGRRRQQRAKDLHALEQQLDARAVEAAHDLERIVGRGSW